MQRLVMRAAISFPVSDFSLFTGVLAAFIVGYDTSVDVSEGIQPHKSVSVAAVKTGLPHKQPAAVCSQSLYCCAGSKRLCLKTPLSRNVDLRAFLAFCNAMRSAKGQVITVCRTAGIPQEAGTRAAHRAV